MRSFYAGHMKATLAVLPLPLVVALSGCEVITKEPILTEAGEILRGGEVETLDINHTFPSFDDNDQFEPSEWTAPAATFYTHDICARDVTLRWQACFMEPD